MRANDCSVLSDKHDLIELSEHYKRWDRDENVYYFPRDTLHEYKLYFKNGKIYDWKGELFSTRTFFRKNKHAIFIVDEVGDIYVSNQQRAYYIHHTSLSRGSAVFTAGTLIIRKGVVELVTNASGHYEPSLESLAIIKDIFIENKIKGAENIQLESFRN